jgi:hypothetical protein
MRICARHGWLPGHTRRYREPLKRLREHARRRLAALLQAPEPMQRRRNVSSRWFGEHAPPLQP